MTDFVGLLQGLAGITLGIVLHVAPTVLAIWFALWLAGLA